MARRLLIVDDIRSNREILKNILSGEYSISEATNGEEALQFLLKNYDSISAVLLDISMPRLNGYEVLQKMRSNVLLATIPVIMITGSENEEERVKALTYGANDFIMKPYSSEILRHCLHNNIAFHEAKATVDTLRRDNVTGLYNRDAFFEQVAHAVFRHEPGYYVMARFDIDKFKVINDQYGTEKGNEVLRHIADTFLDGFEENGGLCCRIAADNFAVLYPTSFKDSDEIAVIRQNASTVEGLIFPLDFTIGRYVVDDLSLSPSAMYDRAALAAETIKGRYDKKIATYDEKMREQLIRDQQIVTEMAIALKTRQFEVWFQPQYNHATGARIGAEALVRWRHPEHGLIPPYNFIPIFEQNGFIYELDKYVWDEVCRCLARWLAEGRQPLPVSVNVSRYDVLRPDLIKTITELVNTYEIPRDLLRLEVTESAFSQSTQPIVAVVKELIGLGFTVEIDDFGSGYSSLNTLKEVPAQILKLDMRFFNSAGDSQRGGSIVESVVRMAKWLDMSVIAEGVEKKEQADYLRSIGCNYIQGYFYAKPMPIEQYEEHCNGAGKEEHMLALETVEHLDNNAFWDAGSIDSLIFNSFVGSACILECNDDYTEAIRATEKFAETISGGKMSIQEALKLDWGQYLNDENKKLFRDAIIQSKQTNADSTVELIFEGLPNCRPKTYIRATIRVIAVVLKRYVAYCLVANITARREAEQKLREAVTEMQIMMDDFPGGFVRLLLKPDGKISTVYVNDAFCKMRNMTAEEILATDSENALTAIHPDDLEPALAMLKEMLANESKAHMIYRILRADGSYIPLNAYGCITKNELGQTFDNIFYTELSEQEKKDLSIREMTPFVLSAIMKSSSDLAFAKDKHFKYICCSPGFVRFTGQKSEEDVVGKTDYELWSKDVADRFRADDVRLFESGKAIIDYTEPIPSTDDVQHYSVTSKYILRDSTGEIIGLYGLGRDVTNTRAALERLQLLTDSIPGGIATYVISPNGIKTNYFNDGLCKMFGCTREEYQKLSMRKEVTARVFPEDLPQLTAQISALYENGTPVDCLFRNYCIKGHGYVWVNIKGTLAERNGDTAFVNAVLYDVTNIHEAQEKQIESQRLLLDNMPYGAALYEYDGTTLKVLHLNKKYWLLVERKPSQYSDLSFMNAVHPDDRQLITESLKMALAQHQAINVNLRILASNSTYKMFHITANVELQENGKYLIYAAYEPLDTNALSYRQALPLVLSAIMKTTNDYAFAKDKDFRYISVSPAFQRIARLSNERDAIGKTDFELFPKYMAEVFRKNDLYLIQSGKSLVDFDETITEIDGSTHYCRASKYPLYDVSGQIVGIYGISHDISKERDVLEQLQLVNDNVPGGIATYAFKDGKLRITYCNDGFCELFGGTMEGFTKRGDFNPIDWILKEDSAELLRQVEALINDSTPMDAVFRIHTVDHAIKWVNMKATVAERHANFASFNALLLDITERQSMNEQLRISEEESTLALQHSGNVVCRYNIADKTLTAGNTNVDMGNAPSTLYDIPYDPVRKGIISPETADAYIAFFEAIRDGKKSGTVLYQQRYLGPWLWTEAKSSTVFASDGTPIKAIISMNDVTERIEKENIYKKWQQSLADRAPESYTLFRTNISCLSNYGKKEGTLITFDFDNENTNAADATASYAMACIYEEDRENFINFTDVDTLLANYYRGKRSGSLEYRENIASGGIRWLRLSIDLVELPTSSDVEAFMMFEDIDQTKRAELRKQELSETDSLTGVLNRMTFITKVTNIINNSKPKTKHALLMLDIDGFKKVNDTFGHSAGDLALIEIAHRLRAVVREVDMVARLGGDEFVIFLTNVPNTKVAIAKAKQIRSAVRKSFSLEVHISASIGIAISPHDGTDFDVLYKKADAALYYVKGTGKDNQSIYSEDMADQHLLPERDTFAEGGKLVEKKRRMLIVDDSSMDHELLQNIFQNKFIIEKAKDGNSALIRLQHYGSSISVILLDLVMPGMDGFAVLEKIQENEELRTIPVIIVSSDESREACLTAIRKGATDFVTKPVNADVLRIRVDSAICKAENDRLRATNYMLEFQNNEIERYRVAMENCGLVVIENDWIENTFIYDSCISEYFAGNFDNRGFWRILLSDFVAETTTVQKMHEMVSTVAKARNQQTAQIVVRLKSPDGKYHKFRMCIKKKVDQFGLVVKFYFTFVDLGEDNTDE